MTLIDFTNFLHRETTDAASFSSTVTDFYIMHFAHFFIFSPLSFFAVKNSRNVLAGGTKNE